ncbi:ankyrin [Mollisia scopiformis]|uniref:Ankyrin n=1 Tax=Mollisia scopiformis TaxID=149040 RepID=A0A194XNU6_MOLSC|nr:ankyrin [Mollisia scopiformis]KUJ21848.1 ankyrin [Mollisia scopiformis]
MSQPETYSYSPLSPGAKNIRLLRLLPYRNESGERTKLQCELLEYSLQDLGKRTHLYEALSYTWGGQEKPCSITINEKNLNVTTNLYAALLHLRYHSLERILWIDAICINQTDPEERGQQVQLMAMIYSKAHRVLVWLGETADDIEGALEDIQRAANEESTEVSNKKINEKAISNLLQRQWFQRIWVLQEVAAARHVVMMCGSTEIDGYAFCLGLKSLRKSQELSDTAFPRLQSLPALTNLIERAGLRPKYTTNSSERYSLEIRSLAELVDMFHTRQASDPRDKVYALLGMSSDDPSKAGLQPNYEISWEVLFQQLVKFILGKDTLVEAFCRKPAIKSKGCILGQVSSVESDHGQSVNIALINAAWPLRKWSLQASAKSVRKGDIVCLLKGASKPTIIRLCGDYFAVVVIAAIALNGRGSTGQPKLSKSTLHFSRDLLLVWDWEDHLEDTQEQGKNENWTKISQVPEDLKAELGDHLDEVTRIWNVALVLGDLKEYGKAEERLREAIKGYEIANGEEHLHVLKGQYGVTPLSWVARNGCNAAVKLLLAKNSIDPDLQDSQYCRTPLSWAAGGGHAAVVKLLLETDKVEVDSKDNDGWTPLSWAVKGGHEAIIRLLLERSKVEVNFKDNNNRILFWWAAKGGDEAVVKLLLETSKVEVDFKDNNGWTALQQAAKGGHLAVVERLLQEKAEVNAAGAADYNGRTALQAAAEGGHLAVVKCLRDAGAV